MRIIHKNYSVAQPRLYESLVLGSLSCLLSICTSAPLSAEDNVLTAAPLATCAVQQITPSANTYEMPPNAAVIPNRNSQADPLDNYSRGSDGQWQIPQQVDRANPWLRLMVLGPERPMLIDVAVFIEGEPFTAAREKLIDTLLNHATVESLVRDAVSVPVPAETADPAVEEEKNKAVEETLTAADEKPAEEKPAGDKDESKAEPAIPTVEIKTRAARTVAQRLVNYMASTEVQADREEIRWLLAEWTGGPALLNLGPAMNWQRIGFAPLWNALDVDADQNLSVAEIAAATERLAQADVDENSIVELEELFAVGPQNRTAPHSYPLVVVLDHETDWAQLHSHLQAAYGLQAAYSRRGPEQQGLVASTASAFLDRIAKGDSNLTPTDLEALLKVAPDAKFRVTLGDKENQVALLSASTEVFSASEQMVTLVRGAEYLEFSAGEPKEHEASEPMATQIAIGAVVDGYPLFRLVDRNGDRRLSARECRNLPLTLAALDRNGDGQISANEKPTAIRLTITRGPHAHELLAAPTSAMHELASGSSTTKSEAPAKEAAAVPAWFTEMDRNRDGDLSRGEFLGTSEQFEQLDRDGDGLISSQEASN